MRVRADTYERWTTRRVRKESMNAMQAAQGMRYTLMAVRSQGSNRTTTPLLPMMTTHTYKVHRGTQPMRAFVFAVMLMAKMVTTIT